MPNSPKTRKQRPRSLIVEAMRKRFISVKKRGKSKDIIKNNAANDEQRPYISGHGDTTTGKQSLDDSQTIMRGNLTHTTTRTLEMVETNSNEDYEYSEQEEAEMEADEMKVEISPDAMHAKDLENQSDSIPSNQFKRTSVHRPLLSQRRRSGTNKLNRSKKSEEKDGPFLDDPILCKMYEAIPELDLTSLPRGGTSIETEAVGRIQVRLISIGKRTATCHYHGPF